MWQVGFAACLLVLQLVSDAATAGLLEQHDACVAHACADTGSQVGLSNGVCSLAWMLGTVKCRATDQMHTVSLNMC